jgi:cell division protein FtsB
VELLFSSLLLLACPVGMGLMMWFMMRGMASKDSTPAVEQANPLQRQELARLRAEVEELKAQPSDTVR